MNEMQAQIKRSDFKCLLRAFYPSLQWLQRMYWYLHRRTFNIQLMVSTYRRYIFIYLHWDILICDLDLPIWRFIFIFFFFCASLFDLSKFKCLNIKNHDPYPSIGLNQNLKMLFLFILMKLILSMKSVVLSPLRVNII